VGLLAIERGLGDRQFVGTDVRGTVRIRFQRVPEPVVVNLVVPFRDSTDQNIPGQRTRFVWADPRLLFDHVVVNLEGCPCRAVVPVLPVCVDGVLDGVRTEVVEAYDVPVRVAVGRNRVAVPVEVVVLDHWLACTADDAHAVPAPVLAVVVDMVVVDVTGPAVAPVRFDSRDTEPAQFAVVDLGRTAWLDPFAVPGAAEVLARMGTAELDPGEPALTAHPERRFDVVIDVQQCAAGAVDSAVRG